MDAGLIERLLALVERSSVSELELTVGDARLRLVKGPASDGGPPSPPPVSGLLRPSANAAPPPAASLETPVPSAPPRHSVRAGFPGTFYRSPAPSEPPFVTDGSTVTDGTQLAILEAMKTMNPIEADVAGTVVTILVADGTAVETGDVLFEIDPAQ